MSKWSSEECGPVSHDEADKIAQRFVDGAFRNHGKEGPHFEIPANPKRDDDLRLSAYIEQQRQRDSEIAALRAELEAAKARLPVELPKCPACGGSGSICESGGDSSKGTGWLSMQGCKDCNGSGRVGGSLTLHNASPPPSVAAKCQECGGNGEVMTRNSVYNCPVCHGSGKRATSEPSPDEGSG